MVVPDDLGEGGEHRLVHAEQPGRAHDPAQQPAQHVAAALVGRDHAVADDHDTGPGVVGDHPEPDVVDGVDAVAAPGELFGPGDHRADQVGLVDVLDTLQQGGDALDAHARCRCSSWAGRRRRVPVLGAQLAADVLHEDQVPDLQVAVLVGDRAAVAAVFGAPVEVDLRARVRPGRARPCPSSCPGRRGAGCARRACPAMRCHSSAASSSFW